MRRRSAHVEVVVLNQQRRRRVPAARLRRVIEDAGRALRVTGEVALVLTSDAPVRRLNARYRHQDKPTDVLSFPNRSGPRYKASGPGKVHARTQTKLGPRAGGLGPDRPVLGPFLGDLAIATGVARRQAREHGHALNTELRILALHGLLHLLGYDHEKDDGRMARAEARLGRQAGLPPALIARTPRRRR